MTACKQTRSPPLAPESDTVTGIVTGNLKGAPARPLRFSVTPGRRR